MSQFVKFKHFLKIFLDVWNIKLCKRYPVFYYDKVDNVGDLINPYMVERIVGAKCCRSYSGVFDHLLPIGSVVHNGTKKSHVWGSGIISCSSDYKNITMDKVYALRGYKTKELLESSKNVDLDIPLGDPALLLPFFYQPKRELPKFKVGLVPHYSEIEMEIFKEIKKGKSDIVKIIDVRQKPESFIREIMECEVVFSSSLHGLIISDSYSIKNKWLKFSSRLIGGEFKFLDYYSTTNHPEEECVVVDCQQDLILLIERADGIGSVKNYLGDRKKLLSSFPPIKGFTYVDDLKTDIVQS